MHLLHLLSLTILSLSTPLLAQSAQSRQSLNQLQWESDFSSFVVALETDTAWGAAILSINTVPAYLANAAINTALGNINPFDALDQTSVGAYFSSIVAALPPGLQPIFASVYGNMESFASRDGALGTEVVTNSFSTAFSTAQGSEPSTAAVGMTTGGSSTASMSMPMSMATSTSASTITSMASSIRTPTATVASVTSSVAPTTSSHNGAARQTGMVVGAVAAVMGLGFLL